MRDKMGLKGNGRNDGDANDLLRLGSGTGFQNDKNGLIPILPSCLSHPPNFGGFEHRFASNVLDLVKHFLKPPPLLEESSSRCGRICSKVPSAEVPTPVQRARRPEGATPRPS